MSCHSFHQWRAATQFVLRAEVKKSSKGGGPGQWSAWKAAEMAKVRLLHLIHLHMGRGLMAYCIKRKCPKLCDTGRMHDVCAAA